MTFILFMGASFSEGCVCDTERGNKNENVREYAPESGGHQERRRGKKVAFRRTMYTLLLDYELFESKGYVYFILVFTLSWVPITCSSESDKAPGSQHLDPASGSATTLSLAGVAVTKHRKRKPPVVAWDNCLAVALTGRSTLSPSHWVTVSPHGHTVTGSTHNIHNDVRSLPQQSDNPQREALNLSIGKASPVFHPLPSEQIRYVRIFLSPLDLVFYMHCFPESSWQPSGRFSISL